MRECLRNKMNILMFVCTTVWCEYMNDVHDLTDNTHVRSKMYREFFHGIVYSTNEECHVRIIYNYELCVLIKVITAILKYSRK